MVEKEPQNLMSEAIVLLNRANNELHKPSKDVVSFAVCTMAQDAMRLMLSAFLLKKKINFNKNDSLKNLYNICTKILPALKNVSLKAINCRDSVKDKKEHYCLSVGQVCTCVTCVNNLKSVLNN